MLFAAVLVNSNHAAFEDAIVPFNGVNVDFRAGLSISVAIFASRMIDNVVLCKLIAELGVARRFIGHNVRFTVKVGVNDRHNLAFGGSLDMERAGATAPLNKCQNGALVCHALFDLDASLTADESLIDLDGRAFASHW